MVNDFCECLGRGVGNKRINLFGSGRKSDQIEMCDELELFFRGRTRLQPLLFQIGKNEGIDWRFAPI